MRPIDADSLKESLLKERDKISLECFGRHSLGCPSPNKHGEAMRGGIRKALRCMEETPTLDYAPVVHGEWVEGLKCSKCGQVDMTKPNFCPNCGAKMDGGKNE